MRFIVLCIIFCQLQMILCQFDYSKCGKNGKSNTNFIAGGTNNPETNPVGNWPWMASIGYYDSDNQWKHQCGATLITEKHFLTAAHCVDIKWKIRVGDVNHESENDDGNAKDLDILNKFIHPEYDGVTSYFDVAILETEEIIFSKAVSPVCLPMLSNDIRKYDNDQAELVGWGSATASGNVSNRLKRVSVKVFSQKNCNTTHMHSSLQRQATIKEKLPELFRSDILCAGSHVGGQGSCHGDSGGPLMYYELDTDSWIQFATVQGSVGDCGDIEYPGIYIRLDHLSVLSFISKTIKKSADIGLKFTQLFRAGTSVKERCEGVFSGSINQVISKSRVRNYICDGDIHFSQVFNSNSQSNNYDCYNELTCGQYEETALLKEECDLDDFDIFTNDCVRGFEVNSISQSFGNDAISFNYECKNQGCGICFKTDGSRRKGAVQIIESGSMDQNTCP